MRNSTVLLLCSFLLLSATACDKADDKKPADAKADDKKAGDDKKATDTAAGEAEKPAAAAGVVELPTLGLVGDAGGEANISEMMGSLIIQAPNLTVSVEAGDEKPKTGEEAQTEAGDYSPVDPKIEALDDGYILTFTNTGGMGTNYWVQSRREIAGKAVWCTTTANSQEQMDGAIAFCKSLRAK